MLSGSGFLALSWSSCCPGLGFRGLGFKGWGFRGLGFGVTIMSRSLQTKGQNRSHKNTGVPKPVDLKLNTLQAGNLQSHDVIGGGRAAEENGPSRYIQLRLGLFQVAGTLQVRPPLMRPLLCSEINRCKRRARIPNAPTRTPSVSPKSQPKAKQPAALGTPT